MKGSSEYKHLSLLRTCEGADVYKACVSVANHGSRLPEEDNLTENEKKLLEVRRLIFLNKLPEAESVLRLMQTDSDFLDGDRHFLLGQVFHKHGQQETACRLMHDAANLYKKTGDTHRELRARVNGAICVFTLESAIFGELYSYELEARSLNFYDIVGNICRSRAISLLVEGQILESHTQALEAAKFYRIDGYQDDHGVAIYIAAIALLLLGDIQRAQVIRSEALTSKGKSETYKKVFDDLIVGKIPSVPEGHALSKVNWKKLFLKLESVPGKIVQRLREKSRTRDELIGEVWGKDAVSQAYCDRLYTAINYLRKEKSIIVIYDGLYYRLA